MCILYRKKYDTNRYTKDCLFIDHSQHVKPMFCLKKLILNKFYACERLNGGNKCIKYFDQRIFNFDLFLYYFQNIYFSWKSK